MKISISNKTYLPKILDLLFNWLFVSFLILGILELIMPGFAVYYINLNWWLGAVIALGVIKLFRRKN